jgi:hypothetical protein
VSLNRLWRGAKGLGEQVAFAQAGQVLERSCIGRVVSMLTGLFIVSCIVLYVLGVWWVFAAGLDQRLGGVAPGGLTVGLLIGFFVAIILAGQIGSALRRILWRALLHRMMRRGPLR